MTFFQDNAPSRDQYTRAKISQFEKVLRKWISGLTPRLPTRQPHLSDHLARDIGLSATELEHHRLELPSQTTYHPRG